MLLENSPMRQSPPDVIGNREDYIESAIGIILSEQFFLYDFLRMKHLDTPAYSNKLPTGEGQPKKP
jgi:hypothetical protein